MSDLKSNISEIRKSFKEAEDQIKNCETDCGELPQGAVNELRYATSHLLSYLDSGNETELQKYHRHCKRARYDSLELPILLIKKEIDIYLSRFRGDEDILSSKLDGNYLKILENREHTNHIIKQANKEKDNREDFLAKIQEVVPSLKENLMQLKHAMPAIETAVKKEKRKKHYTNLGLSLTLLAIIISIVFAMLTGQINL